MKYNCDVENQCDKLSECECYSAALEQALAKICNEFMEVDNTGQFINHRFSEEINMLLGTI